MCVCVCVCMYVCECVYAYVVKWYIDKEEGREGKGRERKGREGREGKGRERKGKEGKGKEGKGRERKGKEGKGRGRNKLSIPWCDHLFPSYLPSPLLLSSALCLSTYLHSSPLHFSPLPLPLPDFTPYKYKNDNMTQLFPLMSHLYNASLSWSSWRCASACRVWN